MGLSIYKTGIIQSTGNTIPDNILLNSATLTGKSGSTVYNNITTGTHTGTSGWNEAYWPCSISAVGHPLSGKTLTISLDFMCTDISKIGAMYFGFGMWNASGSRIGDTNIAVSSYTVINGTRANNTWCRMYNTFTVATSWSTTDGATYRLQIKTAAGAEGATMYHKRIKIEQSSYPSMWTISNADVSNININKGFIENLSFNNPVIPAKVGTDYIQAMEIIEI